MRFRYAVAATAAAAASILFTTLPSSGTPYSAPFSPSILAAGHQLRADSQATPDSPTNSLSSAHNEFRLRVYSGRIELDQNAGLNNQGGRAVTTIWSRSDNAGEYESGIDASTLRMQTDGNLVLYTSTGQALWASRTAGTGSSNYVILYADGDLIMYTSAHREVWSSRTGAIYVSANGGTTMTSGQVLVDRRGDQFSGAVSTLKMEADGNLVYRCGIDELWSSNTHTPGAYLVVQSNGNLVIRTASRAIWSTNTWRAGPWTYLDSSRMELIGSNGAVVWSAPLPRSACTE